MRTSSNCVFEGDTRGIGVGALCFFAGSLSLAACAGPRSGGAPLEVPNVGPAAPPILRNPAPRETQLGLFARNVESILTRLFADDPVEATFFGVHAHDRALPEVRREALARRAQWLRETLARWESEFGELPEEADPAEAGTDRPSLDAALLQRALSSRLLELEDGTFSNDPNRYHSIAALAVYPLVVRNFATPRERLQDAAHRMRGIPALLAAGQENLERPSRLATQVAMEQADGSIQFFRDTVSDFIESVRGQDATLAREADASRQGALRALQDHRSYLENELLARSTGDYHLGRERFVERLRVREGITESPEQLLNLAEQEISRLKAEADRWSRLVSPRQNTRLTMGELSRAHPTKEGLLVAYRSRQEALRTFLVERRLVSFSSGPDSLQLVETPPFLRSTIVAACDSPGPLEERDLTTYFWVTPVDARASESAQEEYLREHSHAAIDVISIHEAYPGHHLQLLASRQVRSKVRRLFWVSTFGEGWAHYAEQMMLDEGYGDGEPRLRLAQIKEALLRAVRMRVDVAIHVQGMTWEEARSAFERDAFLERPAAEMEAKRAALEGTTVLVYTYGKLQILALREKVRAREGASFSLRSFHDRLLSLGSVPVDGIAAHAFGDLPARQSPSH